MGENNPECASRRIISTLVAIFMLSTIGFACLVGGCGGESRGTGAATLSGFIEDQTGSRVSDVTVTILETGASSVSDDQGNFELESEILGTLHLLFEKGSSRVSVTDTITLQEGATEYSLSVLINFSSRTITTTVTQSGGQSSSSQGAISTFAPTNSVSATSRPQATPASRQTAQITARATSTQQIDPTVPGGVRTPIPRPTNTPGGSGPGPHPLPTHTP